MVYKFGRRSKSQLEGVHPKLVDVAQLALDQFTIVDFSIIDGVRTQREQRDLFHQGMTHTLESRHLKQKDGYGHAIDIAPYYQGKIRWDWPLFFKVATAMFISAKTLKVPIRWGGAWTEYTEEYDHSLMDNVQHYSAEFMQLKYIQNRKQDGKNPFLDGPHFELRL